MGIFGVLPILLLGAWMMLKTITDHNERIEIERIQAQVNLLCEKIDRLNCSEDSDSQK